MKKVIYLLFLLFILISCNSREDRAKALVKEYLEHNLDDFSKYEPVSWGELDSVVNILEKNSYYVEKKKLVEDFSKYINNYTDSITKTSGDHRLMLEARKEGAEQRYNFEKGQLDKFKEGFKEGFIGWKIEHSYRAPNKLGALVLKREQFIVDKDFKAARKTQSMIDF